MSEPVVTPGPPPAVPTAGPPPEGRPVRSDLAEQLRTGGLLIAALAVAGLVVGVIWQAWSPAGPIGLIVNGGVQADENEAFAAGDGRFALLAVIAGLIAGVAAWFLRSVRGPLIAAALVLGALISSAVAAGVGYLLRGSGQHYRCGDGSSTCINHLPLTVHMHALLLAEALIAALVYSLFVAFAVADDLGRPDLSVGSQTSAGAQSSVGPQGSLQNSWSHGDAAGPA